MFDVGVRSTLTNQTILNALAKRYGWDLEELLRDGHSLILPEVNTLILSEDNSRGALIRWLVANSIISESGLL